MHEQLKIESLPFQNTHQQRVDEAIKTIKEQQLDVDNRAVAAAFGKFWAQMLSVSEKEKLNIALKIKYADGNSKLTTIESNNVKSLDRKDELWKGTVVDSGTNEAYILITKTDQNGNTDKKTVKVSPFDYKTERGTLSSALKPDALETDRQSIQGKIFRAM